MRALETMSVAQNARSQVASAAAVVQIELPGGAQPSWVGGAGARFAKRTVMALATLAACSTTVPLPPAPEATTAGSALYRGGGPYLVQAGDDLLVRFILTPELNEEVIVRPDGKISTAVAEEVQAAGRTVPAIAEDLRNQYRKELTNPRLNIVVKSFMPTRVYVAGEVTAPGEYTSVGPSPTLSQAIARAGGMKVSGSTERVFLIRRGADDKPQSLGTRYNDVIDGRDPQADIRLEPYDVVYVPRSGIAQAYLNWNQFVQQFVPVSWGFSYVLNQPTGGTAVIPSAR